MIRALIVATSVVTFTSLAFAQDIEKPIERYAAVSHDMITTHDQASLILGEGGKICGPFSMTTNFGNVIFSIKSGECIYGIYQY